MKKRVMLAMAIIMLLGSVKAMASSVDMENARGKWEAAEEDALINSDEMLSNEAMSENARDKSMTAEEDEKARVKAIAMDEIREKIMKLKESALSLESVVTIDGVSGSTGTALVQAEIRYKKLEKHFVKSEAEKVSSELQQAILSVQPH